ncbi:hypothetical protein HYO53_22025 [Vibrio parahaemolyticus]|uniref:hypothetical protein n=2 Tax=Vibrio TaxID=662 RepID=UPI00193E90B5|nr:hypothetical protein [Vibrio parahaemolyticus]HDY7883267.1 hypothetical protein [Vibrio vulnificus]EGR2885175.1 hypothetical protein [Vibrio parahaemolyticus]EGR2977743.1 hypothetical protein [Vibrio parahaemolyticus]EGR3012978.1 hypothetical protein [Vibrio parahaemolyticus]
MLIKIKDMNNALKKKHAEQTIDLGQSIVKSSLLGFFSLPLVFMTSKDKSFDALVSDIANMSNDTFNFILILIACAVFTGAIVRNYGYKLYAECD